MKLNFEDFLTQRNDDIDNAFYALALAVNTDELSVQKMSAAKEALETLRVNDKDLISDEMCKIAVQFAEDVLSEHEITPQEHLDWDISVIKEISDRCETLLNTSGVLTCQPFYADETPCVNAAGECAAQHCCRYCKKSESI